MKLNAITNEGTPPTITWFKISGYKAIYGNVLHPELANNKANGPIYSLLIATSNDSFIH